MTPPLSKDSLIDGFQMSFDPGDPRNGSLYLCEPLDRVAPFDHGAEIARLRAAGLWSQTAEKQVPDSQRDAYKAQLELVEITRYAGPGGHFAIARFDHPKFPSETSRWEAWQAFFDSRYARCP